MKFIEEFFHGVLDVLDAHVFVNDFIILCKHEANLALFFVNEDFEEVDKFPGVCDKKALVSSFEHVEVALCVSDLSFDVADDRFPESFQS